MKAVYLQKCCEVYQSLATNHGKLAKNFKEAISDFENVFAVYIQNAVSSFEVKMLFKAFLVDYIEPEAIKQKSERKQTTAIASGLVSKMEANGVAKEDIQRMDKAVSEMEENMVKAKKLYAQGFSYVQIGKQLGISDKTAKKLIYG